METEGSHIHWPVLLPSIYIYTVYIVSSSCLTLTISTLSCIVDLLWGLPLLLLVNSISNILCQIYSPNHLSLSSLTRSPRSSTLTVPLICSSLILSILVTRSQWTSQHLHLGKQCWLPSSKSSHSILSKFRLAGSGPGISKSKGCQGGLFFHHDCWVNFTHSCRWTYLKNNESGSKMNYILWLFSSN